MKNAAALEGWEALLCCLSSKGDEENPGNCRALKFTSFRGPLSLLNGFRLVLRDKYLAVLLECLEEPAEQPSEDEWDNRDLSEECGHVQAIQLVISNC